MDPNQLQRNLTHHSPDEVTQGKIQRLRHRAKQFAEEFESVPEGRAKSLAQTKLEESVMWAIKAMVVPGA